MPDLPDNSRAAATESHAGPESSLPSDRARARAPVTTRKSHRCPGTPGSPKTKNECVPDRTDDLCPAPDHHRGAGESSPQAEKSCIAAHCPERVAARLHQRLLTLL